MAGDRSFFKFNEGTTGEHQHDCLNDVQFFNLFEGQLSKTQKQIVLTHLNSCKKCFSTLISLKKTRPYLYSHSGKTKYTKKKSLSQKEQVDLILKNIELDQQKSANKAETENTSPQPSQRQENIPPPQNISLGSKLYNDLRQALSIKLPAVNFQVSTLFLSILFIATVSAAGVFFLNHYLAEFLFNGKMSDLGNYVKIGKLAGDYRAQPFIQSLGPEENISLSVNEQIAEAQIYADKVIESGNISPGFLQKYFQLSIMALDFPTADSIFYELQNKKNIKQTADLMNDFGVYYIAKAMARDAEYFEKAENYFQKIIGENPEYKNAYYNLALINFEQKDNQSAYTYLDKYKEIETKNDWLSAAHDLGQEYEKE
ncbi:MAG: tetratricopeptide repeat protein [bacterium]